MSKRTFIAGASAVGQYLLVKTPAAFVVSAADTDVVFGVTQDSVAATGKCTICTDGETFAVASAAIADGDALAPAPAGKVKTAEVGDLICGYAEGTATAANDIIAINFQRTPNVLA
jgi:hypothetical protein